MAGRRPKPLAIHQLNGNPRHFSKADLEGSENFQPEKSMPEMPKGGGKLARRTWKREGPPLFSAGILTSVDGQAFWCYCLAVEERDIALKDMQKNGRTFRSVFENKEGELVTGDIKANPAVAQFYAATKTIKAFEIEFGLTPASRSKLKIDKKDSGDAMEQYLKRKAPTTPVGFHAPAAPVNRGSANTVGCTETVVNPASTSEVDPTKS